MLNEAIEDADTIIDALDKDVDEIMKSVDEIIESGEKHIKERHDNGEEESVVLSNKLHVNDDKVTFTSSYVKQNQLEAKEASEGVLQVEKERQKEQELERVNAKLQLTKRWTEEARNVAALNQLRADAAKRESGLRDKDTIALGIPSFPRFTMQEKCKHAREIQ